MAKFDPSIVLQMFQQSKMNAEDAIEKDRLARINEQLERDRMTHEDVRAAQARGDEMAYRVIASQQHKADQLQQQNQFNEQLAFERDKNKMNERHWQADNETANKHWDLEYKAKMMQFEAEKVHWQQMLEAQGVRFKNGRPMTATEAAETIKKEKLALSNGFDSDMMMALKGGDDKAAPIDLRSDPLQGVFGGDQKAMKERLEMLKPRLQAALGVIQKYRDNNYDVELNKNSLLGDFAQYMQKITGGSTYRWSKATDSYTKAPVVSNGQAVTAFGSTPVAPIYTQPTYDGVGRKWNDEMYNSLDNINTYLKSFPSVNVPQGYTFDWKTRQLVKE